jgi:zinc transporter, ZIP family
MSDAVADRSINLRTWIAALVPIALLAGLIVTFLAFDPIGSLREVPPVEAVSVERAVLEPGSIELTVRNDGPDPVTIAQTLVNDAYSQHDIQDRTLGRLKKATITIDYPWEEGLPLNIGLVTSTGLVIEHEIEAAASTPQADAETLWIYALLGVYIGVIPVAVGLLWLPALRRAAKRWITFFLAFTVGLLAFLLVDTVAEGLELAGQTGAALNGLGLFSIGALAAVLALSVLGSSLGEGRKGLTGLTLAYLIAAGIGLHNLGEGLAVGAALAAGEAALGTTLVLGFAIHNTTEGLAIVSPLGGGSRPSIWHLVALGAVAGAPTVAGAWLGGFAFAPAWGALAFGIAAGAIAQVVFTIGRSMDSGRQLTRPIGAAGLLIGVVAMYGTGLFAG